MSDNQKQNPYLSIIVYSRNDDHGGNYYRRFCASINGILLQAERHHLRSELILVEWNPPPDTPLLKDVFPWPKYSSFCSVRGIVVSASIHARYDFSDKIPIHMTAAFNAGIRRARGEFILSTTPDILFSDELIEFLASEELDKGAMYGIDRPDVKKEVTLLSTLEQQLSYCQQNIIVINPVGSCYFGSKEAPTLDKHGCGDFTILSKERWHWLHGFPETDIVSLYADSILSYMAYLSGAREIILSEPMRIYHIDHIARRIEVKSKPFTFLVRIRTRFNWPGWFVNILRYPVSRIIGPKSILDNMKVPHLSDTQYRNIVSDMISGKRPYIFNDENWGLAKESLEEFLIVKADWDKGYGKDK